MARSPHGLSTVSQRAPAVCWLCARPLGQRIEWHHPRPKSRGGRQNVPVRRIAMRRRGCPAAEGWHALRRASASVPKARPMRQKLLRRHGASGIRAVETLDRARVQFSALAAA